MFSKRTGKIDLKDGERYFLVTFSCFRARVYNKNERDFYINLPLSLLVVRCNSNQLNTPVRLHCYPNILHPCILILVLSVGLLAPFDLHDMVACNYYPSFPQSRIFVILPSITSQSFHFTIFGSQLRFLTSENGNW